MTRHATRRRRAALALVTLGTLALGLAPSAALADAPVNRIAYSKIDFGIGTTVYTANPNASDEQQVPIPGVLEDFGIPVWSPDHTSDFENGPDWR